MRTQIIATLVLTWLLCPSLMAQDGVRDGKLQELQAKTEKDPQNIDLWLQLGQFQFEGARRGRADLLEQAEQSFARALQLKSNDPRALVWHGAVMSVKAGAMFQSGKLDEAQRLLTQGFDEMDRGMTSGEPAAVVGKINQLFYENSVPEMFATLFYGVYDGAQERFTFCNAGHNPPLLLQGDTVRRLEQGGTVVGMFAGTRYEQATIGLPPGSMVVGYSDGLTELTNQAGEEFGEERLVRVVRDQLGLSAASLKKVILESARDFAPQPYPDDLTVMILKVTS